MYAYLVAPALTSKFAANVSKNHESLQAESQKARTVCVAVGDCNLISKICNKPLTSIWETIPELSLDSFFTAFEELLVALFCPGGG